ncbi:hypothetical protein TBR22_A34980 [Luteitalea sp. TBR-22]|uniref:hypothetical protein n=1 Tax=Luteitalea sp. TBR-22 TaxID=2802971 RepID=UPI001AFB1EDA|nr:hypothetical protein [Luteitalea sp. TBR-22]BCS34269.1 hypothetical protein TBR22_A34980 [Luteitalea sp. TBR-22]
MRFPAFLAIGVGAALGISVAVLPPVHAQGRGKPAPKAPAKAAAAPKPNPTVSLAGLQVVARSLGKGRFRDAVAFDAQPGVSIALGVKVAPGTALLDIDDDDSEITAWTDDKQTDMNIEPDWGSFPTYTEDQSAGIISVRTPMLPAAGASSVTVTGTLGVTTAAGTRTVQARKVALTKGTSFQLGTIAGVVGDFEPTDTGGTITLKVAGRMSAMKRLRFLDAAGTEIEADANGSMTSPLESEYTYTLKAKATTATIELELWQNLQTTPVPFTVTATVGSFK